MMTLTKFGLIFCLITGATFIYFGKDPYTLFTMALLFKIQDAVDQLKVK